MPNKILLEMPEGFVQVSKERVCYGGHGMTTPAQQPEPAIPKRRKGADHFGYGNQVALGKHKDGSGLWHSHGKHYHKPDTYWCGNWGDRTPEELLSECESVITDMRLYHPELFRTRPHPPAPSRKEKCCKGCDAPACCEHCNKKDCWYLKAVKDKASRSATLATQKRLADLITMAEGHIYNANGYELLRLIKVLEESLRQSTTEGGEQR
jgi:hypothetical protein